MVSKINTHKLKQIARPYIMSASGTNQLKQGSAIKNLLNAGQKYSVSSNMDRLPDLIASQ